MDENYIRLSERPTDPLGGASGEKRIFTADFLGKTNNADFPYTIANEVVGAFLGQCLGLNLPTVLTHQIGNEVFALIQMVPRDPLMPKGPPASSQDLAEFVRQMPFEVHGAIVFDLFIANNDRAFGPERRNLALDRAGRLFLYDQGNCCFYRPRRNVGGTAGIERLNRVEANLSALFDMDYKGNHYREFLSDWRLVEEWCQRIAGLPDFLIDAAVDRIPIGMGTPTAEERDRLKQFLKRRRQKLFDDIRVCRAAFAGLPPTEGRS